MEGVFVVDPARAEQFQTTEGLKWATARAGMIVGDRLADRVWVNRPMPRIVRSRVGLFPSTCLTRRSKCNWAAAEKWNTMLHPHA